MYTRGHSSMGVAAVMYLDVSRRYSYIDKKEVKWAFTYQNIASDEGWYVWRTAPGQVEICIGRTDEADLINKLTENPPLSDDDLIDLELWLSHGGLDKYQPRKEK